MITSRGTLSVSKCTSIKQLIRQRDRLLKKAKKLQRKIKKVLKGTKRGYKRQIHAEIKPDCKSSFGRLRVEFNDDTLNKLSKICFSILRFIPTPVKQTLQYRGQWDDIAQTIYLSVIEFWRKHKRRINGKPSPQAYHRLMRIANRNMYKTFSDIVTDFGRRKFFEKSMDSRGLNQVSVSADGKFTDNYVKEESLKIIDSYVNDG